MQRTGLISPPNAPWLIPAYLSLCALSGMLKCQSLLVNYVFRPLPVTVHEDRHYRIVRYKKPCFDEMLDDLERLRELGFGGETAK